MTQDQVLILLFKVAELFAMASIIVFVAVYWRLAPWWRNPIGRTIVIKDIALFVALIPSALSLFLQFNRLTSHIAAWFDMCCIASIGVIMLWRTAVWIRVHKSGEVGHLPAAGPEKTGDQRG